MNIAVVVPTIREDCIRRWAGEWAGQLSAAQVIVVEDNPQATVAGLPGSFTHYSWRDIDRDLRGASWIIPRRTSAIKAYGFLKAFQQGADIIWTLDDDCYPEPGRGYITEIASALVQSTPQDRWWNTLPGSQVKPRGFPYGVRDQRRPVMVSHGLWSHIPDLDGITQRDHPGLRLPPAQWSVTVPRGQFFPMCGMNLAWRREMTPAMYFMLMGENVLGAHWGYDRFDDMFAGLFVKRICDHLDYAIRSGSPSIRHDKASDTETNIRKEAPGLAAYEQLWPLVEAVPLGGERTVAGCYHLLADAIRPLDINGTPLYWRALSKAMHRWADRCC